MRADDFTENRHFDIADNWHDGNSGQNAYYDELSTKQSFSS